MLFRLQDPALYIVSNQISQSAKRKLPSSSILALAGKRLPNICRWSGRQDLNPRPFAPEAHALLNRHESPHKIINDFKDIPPCQLPVKSTFQLTKFGIRTGPFEWSRNAQK